MKKNVFLVLTLVAALTPVFAYAAEETAAQATEILEPAAPAAVESVPAAEETAVPVAAPAPPAEESAEATVNENLEFVSGEVSAIDAAAKSVTVKLYGETEETTTDQTLTVTTDDSTDITDGEKDRELTSLSAGTEVDVEYDPANKKATYIFVY